jgi:transposase
MSRRKKSKTSRRGRSAEAGQIAKATEQTLRSYRVGAMPIINRLLERMGLEKILREHLPRDGRRTGVPTATCLMILVRNFLVSREPVYGVGEWACQYAPDLLGLRPDQVELLNDDRLGRATDRLFECPFPDLVMAVMRLVIPGFALSLDELHNDGTTVSFFGAYDEAAEEGHWRGRSTVAITYGHSKARRPDLKQLLYNLTVTDDGGVPIYFTTHSGNTTDDQTHRQTWDVLRELVGSPAFLYVADCKLATTENMKYIDRQGGRFISVLPATRKEDKRFRERLASQPDSVPWDHLEDVRDEDGQVVDQLFVCPEETLTKERFRLWWFYSPRKARRDEAARLKAIQRATVELKGLQERLLGPRPRLKTRQQVEPAMAQILKDAGAEELLTVDIRQYVTEDYRQTAPGRPGPNTKYVKKTKTFCDLAWEVNARTMGERKKTDGVFPLITNCRQRTAAEVLWAYKRQPIIEKRFSQLKTDFAVAPVYLKSVHRIQAMLCLYFFTLLVQTLLERELRQAMEAADLESLPLYPERRDCKAPTTRRILDIFEPIQRHTLTAHGKSETFVSELSPLQRRLLKLLNIPSTNYGL